MSVLNQKGRKMAKIRNMSVALELAFQDKLKSLAQEKNVSVSFLIRETLEKYLFAEKDTVKLVLHLPKNITNDSQHLEKWLTQKCHAILNHFKT